MPAEDVGIYFPPEAEGFDPRTGFTHEATSYKKALPQAASWRDLCLHWRWQIPHNSGRKECKLSRMFCVKRAQGMA